ncbi:MAG TPA: glycosyltransferase family 4 protein, partial [Actinomycetota bacterium]|nr:glycosyltransferase family 4 protein [Actinomycetota bacterium]
TPSRTPGPTPSRTPRPSLRRTPRRTLRVGVITPLPPQPTGVAVYSARLLEALAQRFAGRADPTIELDVFIDALEGGTAAITSGAHPPVAPPGATLHPVEQLARVSAARGGYDVMVYAIGNSEFHTGALGAARTRPGIVLAHDVALAQLYAFAAHHGVIDPEGPGSFAGLAARLYPERAAELGTLPNPLLVDPARFAGAPVSMAKELIGCSLAFLTTSPFAASMARLEAAPGDEARVGVLVHACRLLPPRPPERVDEATVVSFGVVNAAKDLATLIDAFALVRAGHPTARLVLAGQASDKDRAAALAMARRAGVAGEVTVTGALSDAEWDAWLGRATLAVQLRRGSNGEFSGAVAEALAAGVPTITAGLGSAAGLPEGTALVLPGTAGGPPGATAVAEAIGALLDDPARRVRLAGAAREFARGRSFPAVAEELEQWILAAASGRSRRAPGTTMGCRTGPPG